MSLTVAKISDNPAAPLICAKGFETGDPLITALGPIHLALSDCGLTMAAAPSPTACNAGGFLHGGAISTWLDMAMYQLAKRRLGACVTISMDVSFLAPGQLLPLTVTARFLRSGRSLAFVTADIAQFGKSIAAANAIYKSLD